MSDLTTKIIADTFNDVASALRERGLSTFANDLMYAKRDIDAIITAQAAQIATLTAEVEALTEMRNKEYRARVVLVVRVYDWRSNAWEWNTYLDGKYHLYGEDCRADGSQLSEVDARAAGEAYTASLIAPKE